MDITFKVRRGNSEITWFINVLYFQILIVTLGIGSSLLLVCFFKHLCDSRKKSKQIFNPVGGGEDFSGLTEIDQDYHVIDRKIHALVLKVIDMDGYDPSFPLVVSLELFIYIIRIQMMGGALVNSMTQITFPRVIREMMRKGSLYVPDSNQAIIPCVYGILSGLVIAIPGIMYGLPVGAVGATSLANGLLGLLEGNQYVFEIRKAFFAKKVSKLVRFVNKDEISIDSTHHVHLPEHVPNTSLSLDQKETLQKILQDRLKLNPHSSLPLYQEDILQDILKLDNSLSLDQKKILETYISEKNPEFMIPRKGDLIIVKGSGNAKYLAPAAVEEYKIFKNLAEVPTEIIDIPEENYKNMTHISRYDSTSDQNLASSALNYHRKHCDDQEYRRTQKLIRDLKKASKILPSPESAIQEQRYNQTQKPKSYWESTLETGELMFNKTKTFLGFESIEPKIKKGRYSNTGSGRRRSTFKKLMTNVLSLPKNSTNNTCDPAEVEIDLQNVPRGGFYQTNRHLRVEKKTKRWQKLEQTIVLILGITALVRFTIISDSHIDEHLVPKDRNKKIVRLQNQMVFENLNLEKISIKNTNDTPNIDGGNFEVNSKTRKILDKSKYQVVKIGDSLIVQERLSIKDQTKIAQMLEEEFNFIPELNETPKTNELKSIVRKKRQQVKKLSDLAPLNFEGTDTINCNSDTNSLKIRIKT